MKIFRSCQRSPRSAFSLVELLVVVALLGLLAVLAVPALTSILESGRLNRATNQVLSTLSVAAQRASAENRAIGVRMIRPGNEDEWRFLQVVEILPDGTVQPIERLVALADGTAIASSAQLSSFFHITERTKTTQDPDIAAVGNNYRFREFQFRPDGRMNLDVTQKWYLTVMHGAPKADPSSTTPPTNYATIQVDPVNGSTTLFRP